MKTQCNWQLKQAMKSLLMFSSIPFCYFTLIWAFPPLITLSLFELHQTTLARWRLWHIIKNAQVESFDTRPVSVHVPSSHTPYPFSYPRLKIYCSGSIIIFSHAQWQPPCSNVAVTVSCVRACLCVVVSLHSTPLHSHQQQMLVNPPALLRPMNRRQVPEGKHARCQVPSLNCCI